MTQQEFEKLAGHKIDSKSYEAIERIYNETSLIKEEFVKEVGYISRGVDILESAIVKDMLERIESLQKSLDSSIDKINNNNIDNTQRAISLIGKACKYEDLDLYNLAINLIGIRSVVFHKLASNLPLWENDRKYILECLRTQ